MSLHRAEDIATEIHRRIGRCAVALGAETDLGAQVFHGRRRVDDSMIPCATIIEADDTPSQVRRGKQYEVAQRYIVFAYVPCNPNNPNLAAHAAIRDIKRALFAFDAGADMRFGGRVHHVEYVGRDIGPRADGAAFVVAAVELVVTYVEDLSNP